jgi:hypothetical protein
VIVRDLCSSFEGWSERERERESVRERIPVRHEEIVLVTTLEQQYVSEPMETKYLRF